MATHHEVIEDFVKADKSRAGTSIFARDGVLFSRYRGYRGGRPALPLAVRLENGRLLVNGNSLFWPEVRYQSGLLREVQSSGRDFGVVPFNSITAAWTGGKVRSWDEAPLSVSDIRDKVSLTVPSQGEKWRTVRELNDKGEVETRDVHTLGESVVRIRDRYYLSTVDETARRNNTYFLIELLADRAPASFGEAVDLLKPGIVKEAEAQGRGVVRQGEWFAIPTQIPSSVLMGAVERGVAIFKEKHTLGRDGHHQLEQAVIFKTGPKKGEVYARGEMSHTEGDHDSLNLGFRWHRIVHNVQGQAYNLVGAFD
ncbi:MAG: hypothetical protein ABSC23_11585 [Bryobacteraceae bacterium]|jgi:hypothetical protein